MDDVLKPAEDYTVGYGKPPLHSRFKEGQKSANPHGRPTASRSTSTIWREILDRPLKDNVVTAETNSREALLIKAFHEAYNGKLRITSSVSEDCESSVCSKRTICRFGSRSISTRIRRASVLGTTMPQIFNDPPTSTKIHSSERPTVGRELMGNSKNPGRTRI